MNTTLSPSKQISFIALFTCLSLIFSYVEFILPLSIGIPGVKLGVANVVIIVALYLFNTKIAFTISLLRILLSGFLFSGTFGILYSIAGGMLSLAVMALIKKTGKFSVIGVSIAGSVTHNFGQLLMATFIIANTKVFYYFPILIFSGIICGTIVGAVSHIIITKLEKQFSL